jgi:hypothetical protein
MSERCGKVVLRTGMWADQIEFKINAIEIGDTPPSFRRPQGSLKSIVTLVCIAMGLPLS